MINTNLLSEQRAESLDTLYATLADLPVPHTRYAPLRALIHQLPLETLLALRDPATRAGHRHAPRWLQESLLTSPTLNN